MPSAARLLLTLTCCALTGGCALIHKPKEQTVCVAVEGPCTPEEAEEAHKLLYKAERLLDHGHIAKAEEKLLEAVALNPALGAAHNNLGLIYFSRRQLYEAAHAFDRAIRLMPGSGLPHNNMGLVLEEGGRRDQAILHYEEAYALEPHNAEFLGNLARARIARGDTTDDIVVLLEELVFLDSRPEWVEWGQDEMNLMLPKARRAAMLERDETDRQTPATGDPAEEPPPLPPVPQPATLPPEASAEDAQLDEAAVRSSDVGTAQASDRNDAGSSAAVTPDLPFPPLQ